MYQNEPEWILDGRKISEEQELLADIADKDALYDDEKALISMRNNEIRVEKFLSQKRMRDYYFGSDDAELIQAANLAKTPEEAQHILDEMKIDSDKHMVKRRKNLTLISQDRDQKVAEGDVYTTESEDDMPHFRGRLNDQRSFANLVDHFEHKILHMPDKPFDIKELEENIHYRQKAYTGFLTPQNMTMMEGDPEQARRAFEDAKRYFVDTKDSPQEDAKISKKKFQDHPEVRYVASSPFDYSVIPSVGEKIITDEQQMIQDLIARLDASKRDRQDNSQDGLNGKYDFFTDSEEEREFFYAMKNDPEMMKLTDPLYFKNLRQQYEDLYEHEMAHIDKSEYDVSRVYEYPEEDIEEHIAHVRKELPDVEVNWSYDEQGKKVVALTLHMRNKYKLPEVQRMYDKYKEAAKNPNFEVDTEDEAFFRDLENGFDPQRFVNEISRQFEVEEVAELGDLKPDIETLKSMGMTFGTNEFSEDLREVPDWWKQLKDQAENPTPNRMYKRSDEYDYDDHDMLEQGKQNDQAMANSKVIDVESAKEQQKQFKQKMPKTRKQRREKQKQKQRKTKPVIEIPEPIKYYKSLPCKWYVNGAWSKGSEWTYDHDVPQIKKRELWKFALTNCCTKGEEWVYNHDFANWPWKYLHSSGVCEQGEKCRFSHFRLQTSEIQQYIEDNVEFLDEIYQEHGWTNLGIHYARYRAGRGIDLAKIFIPPLRDPSNS